MTFNITLKMSETQTELDPVEILNVYRPVIVRHLRVMHVMPYLMEHINTEPMRGN